jgi:hypothetical protein
MRKLLVVLVLAAAGSYFGAKLYIQHRVGNFLDSSLAQMRPWVDATYGTVTATLTGELRIDDVRARFGTFNDGIRADRINIITPGFGYLWNLGRGRSLDMPESLGIELTDIRFASDADFMREVARLRRTQLAGEQPLSPADICVGTYGLAPDTLKRLGYDELVADVRMLFRKDAGELVLDFRTAIENMYDIDMSVTLNGLTDPTALARGVRPLLVGARLDYVDRSLKSRVMKLCVEDYALTKDEVVAAELQAIRSIASQNGMELDDLIIEPYTRFLLHGQRFLLTSKPPQPVDLSRLGLYKPSDVPNLLNLVAEAN